MNIHAKTLEIRGIAIASISAALSIIMLTLTLFFPALSLLIILFSSLLGALVSLKTSIKIQIPYIFVILSISFINIQDGFFQLVPNTIIGLLFGNLVKKNYDIYFLFLSTTILSSIMNMLSFYPIKFLYNVDMIEIYAKVFNLNRADFINIYPIFNVLLSSIEMTVLTFVSLEEIKKFNIKINTNIDIELNSLIALSLLLIGLVLYINYTDNRFLGITILGYATLPIGIIILDCLIRLINKKKYWNLIPILLCSTLIFIFYISYDIHYINLALLCSLSPLVIYNLMYYFISASTNALNKIYFFEASANILRPAVVKG